MEDGRLKGIIYKGIGGFYYVKSDQTLYECKARGIFKKEGITPMVGDKVTIGITDPEEKLGVIESISERKTELLRPVVANVEQAIVVFAIKNPLPNMMLLDKMLVLAEDSGLEIVVCFNKGDLDVDFDFEKYQSIYERAGYKVIKTCALLGEGIDDLKAVLKGKISVFSGPSGVGKSSILNALHEGFSLQTGELSDKIKRGKHTTRHSELLELGQESIVVDTPGFTSLNMQHIELEELQYCFPEIERYRGECQFDDCTHINEPKCGIKDKVDSGEIAKERYDAYIYMYHEIEEQKRRNKKW